MLKNISPILSPELLKILMEMGHGDEIVIADGNFPCESMGKNAHTISQKYSWDKIAEQSHALYEKLLSAE